MLVERKGKHAGLATIDVVQQAFAVRPEKPLLFLDSFKVVEPAMKFPNKLMPTPSEMSDAVVLCAHALWQALAGVHFRCVERVPKAHLVTSTLHIIVSEYGISHMQILLKKHIQHLLLSGSP
jgi:hypothetical protein